MMHKFHQDEVQNEEEISDEMLMRAVAGGAVKAMDSLYQRYGHILYALVYRMVTDHQMTEDLLQDIFLLVWKRATSYSAQSGPVRSWLIAIAHTRTTDYLRVIRHSVLKEATWEEVEQDERTTQPNAVEGELQSIQAEHVRKALMTLPIEQRMVIELAYFQGRTHLEIAEVYQLPLGTVKSHMNLGLKYLKHVLARTSFTEP